MPRFQSIFCCDGRSRWFLFEIVVVLWNLAELLRHQPSRHEPRARPVRVHCRDHLCAVASPAFFSWALVSMRPCSMESNSVQAQDPGLHRWAVHIFAEENPKRKENKVSGLGLGELLIECEKGREVKRKKNTCIAFLGFCLWSAIAIGLNKAKRLTKMNFFLKKFEIIFFLFIKDISVFS